MGHIYSILCYKRLLWCPQIHGKAGAYNGALFIYMEEMPPMGKLTVKKCDTNERREKPFKLFDGQGLYLEITPKGQKYWRYKYRIHGKEKRFAIGVYPDVGLKEARERHIEARKLVAQLIDPSQQKRINKTLAADLANNTFKHVGQEWYETKKSGWSENYARKILLGLEKNIYPFIGNRPISEIKPPELLSVLRKIEGRGSLDIAGRTKQICGQIFKYGIQTGRCEWNPAQNLTGALKAHTKEHFRALSIEQLPDFLKALERNEIRLFERTRNAVWLSLFTFCRPKEIRMARWRDIDFENAEWNIPAEFMKMRKEHTVPLSKQALKVLEKQSDELQGINTEWVFPSQIGFKRPMSDGTVNKAIKSLGYGKQAVAHGFRALARTAIAENLKYPSEYIEIQLAHKTSAPNGAAYDRATFKDERKIMMQEWADYIEAMKWQK